MRQERRLARARAAFLAVESSLVLSVAPAGVAAADLAAEVGEPAPSVTTSYPTRAGFNLTVSPARLVIGQDELGRTQRVLVVNMGRTDVDVVVDKRPFTSGSDGSLTWVPTAAYSAANWTVVSPASFRLRSGAQQSVTVEVTMPPDAEPGDHQVALVFLVPGATQQGNIAVNRGVAAPVFITAPGPIDTSVVIESLTAPPVSLFGAVPLAARLRHVGTVHRDFRGGGALVVRDDGAAVFPDITIPRGATRDVTAQWHPPWACVCNPTLSFVNPDGDMQSRTVQVVVVPWYLIAGLLALIVLAAFLFRRRGRPRGAGPAVPEASPLSSVGAAAP